MKPFKLDEHLKNPSRKLITRDGRTATKVLCTNAKGRFPIVALVESFDGDNETAISYTNKGHLFDGADYNPDLFFAPEKHEGWINIFKIPMILLFLGENCIYSSKEDAEREGMKCDDYVSTVKVEWEE